MAVPELMEISQDSEEEEDDTIEIELEVPFATEKEAEIAFNSLRIDKEPQRGNVLKELEIVDKQLIIRISSKDGKKLRSAVTSLMDFLILVINTIAAFGQPTSPSESPSADDT